MKTQKGLAVLATLSLLGLSVACSDKYAEGLADGKALGYASGYDVGYSDGDQDGFDRAKVYLPLQIIMLVSVMVRPLV